MQSPLQSTGGIAYPDDMKLLKGIFDQACDHHHIKSGSKDAEALAQAAMALFNAGVVDQADLTASLAEFIKRRS